MCVSESVAMCVEQIVARREAGRVGAADRNRVDVVAAQYQVARKALALLADALKSIRPPAWSRTFVMSTVSR